MGVLLVIPLLINRMLPTCFYIKWKKETMENSSAGKEFCRVTCIKIPCLTKVILVLCIKNSDVYMVYRPIVFVEVSLILKHEISVKGKDNPTLKKMMVIHFNVQLTASIQ